MESHSPDWADILAKEWLELIRGIYSKRKSPNNGVSDTIVSKTGKELSRAVNEAFGQTIDYNAVDEIPREILKKNIWKFSVAKNYNDCIRLSNLLVDKDGKIKKWNDFKHDALQVVGESNRYLKTEYDTVVAGAMMSSKWHDIQRDKAIFPFVKFQVVSDDRTSEICKPLHEVVVKADDPFLEYYFPTNHFNCRTDVIKLRDAEITPNEELPQVDIPEAFLNNVGESGELFTEENPYIKNTPNDILENIKPKIPYEICYQAKNGSKVWKHPFCDLKDFEDNLKTAKVITERLNIDVFIREHINKDFYKNPEYEILGIVGDRAEPKSKNIKRAISNAFDDKLGKGKQLREFDECFLVIDLSHYELSGENLMSIGIQSWQRYSHYSEKLKYIFFIHQNMAISVESSLLKEGFDAYYKKVITLKKSKET